jgi:hypothetical protein
MRRSQGPAPNDLRVAMATAVAGRTDLNGGEGAINRVASSKVARDMVTSSDADASKGAVVDVMTAAVVAGDEMSAVARVASNHAPGAVTARTIGGTYVAKAPAISSIMTINTHPIVAIWKPSAVVMKSVSRRPRPKSTHRPLACRRWKWKNPACQRAK